MLVALSKPIKKLLRTRQAPQTSVLKTRTEQVKGNEKETHNLCWEGAGKTSLFWGFWGLQRCQEKEGYLEKGCRSRTRELAELKSSLLVLFCSGLCRRKNVYIGMSSIERMSSIGITAAWSFGKQSLKYLAVFESQSGTQKK